METPLRIFIGYDERQPVAFQVCAQSIWEHASRPVSIQRLDLRTLPIKRRGLTSFTYSRFLVPYLSGFKGESLFLDSDILVRGDVWEFDEMPNGKSAVSMVMHERKFERPSVMFFNNHMCQQMTPEFVEREKLFDFAWAGEPFPLFKEWNHLVGYDAPNPNAKIVHFTMGIPVWKETAKCEFAREWIDTYARMNSTVSFEDLMGRSVHIPHLDKLKVTA